MLQNNINQYIYNESIIILTYNIYIYIYIYIYIWMVGCTNIKRNDANVRILPIYINIYIYYIYIYYLY